MVFDVYAHISVYTVWVLFILYTYIRMHTLVGIRCILITHKYMFKYVRMHHIRIYSYVRLHTCIRTYVRARTRTRTRTRTHTLRARVRGGSVRVA